MRTGCALKAELDAGCRHDERTVHAIDGQRIIRRENDGMFAGKCQSWLCFVVTRRSDATGAASSGRDGSVSLGSLIPSGSGVLFDSRRNIVSCWRTTVSSGDHFAASIFVRWALITASRQRTALPSVRQKTIEALDPSGIRLAL